MLTTIYLMLAVCSGANNCHYGIMESFEGTKQNAEEACNIARQDYPKSSKMGCYVLQGEDENTEYYENINEDEFLEIYK
ncbi:hypothetical protein ACNCUE_000149 [Shigella flexneri]|nr:hypothetical protein [Shigella phage ESh21]